MKREVACIHSYLRPADDWARTGESVRECELGLADCGSCREYAAEKTSKAPYLLFINTDGTVKADANMPKGLVASIECLVRGYYGK